MCDHEFIGVPYAVVKFPDGKEKDTICNAGCWKAFLQKEKEKLKNEIEDGVLMTPEAIAFQGLLEHRADFGEILDTLKGEVAGYRGVED